MPIGCTLPGLIRRPTVHVLPKPTPAVEVELIAAIFNYLHLQISSSLSSSAANAHWLYRLSLLAFTQQGKTIFSSRVLDNICSNMNFYFVFREMSEIDLSREPLQQRERRK